MTEQKKIDLTPMYEVNLSFGTAPGGDLVIKHEQHIPDEFISECRLERADSIHTPAGEFHRVARIPEGLIEKWGMAFVMNAPVEEILKRLRKEELDGFITSNKVR